MKLFLLVISIFWVSVGTTAALSPLKFKTFFTHLIKPAKWLFILPLLIGSMLLWSSPASSLEALIKVLAIIALIKGIFILACPINVIKAIFNFWLTRSDAFYRFYGAFNALDRQTNL